jgi:hypothetical protein
MTHRDQALRDLAAGIRQGDEGALETWLRLVNPHLARIVRRSLVCGKGKRKLDRRIRELVKPSPAAWDCGGTASRERRIRGFARSVCDMVIDRLRSSRDATAHPLKETIRGR